MIASSRILWLPGEDDVEARHIPWDTEGSTGSRNPAGVRVDPDTALKSTVVLACARVLAESMASLPLHLYRYLPTGGKEIARDHPLYHRLRIAPNSWQTSFEWLEQQVLWLALWGNSYNLLVAGSAGFATEIQPLHPSRMKPERIENGRIRYKYRTLKGGEETYTQDQIMHIRWLSDDGLEGMVPVDLARDAIALARACEIHGGRYFGNGARPGFVLSTDNDMKPEAARELRDNWERMHRGPDRANRTAVLFGGLKPVEIGGANMQESQFLETRRFQIEEICRLYRVPPHLVGDLTRSSFSNIEQQSLDFLQHTLLPWCRRFENAFSRDLITDDEKYFAEFDTRGMLRGDAAARASYYQTMWNLGVASINEIRGWENLNPVEGGDTRFVQLNMQTLANAVNPPQPAAAEAAPPQAAQPTAEVDGVIAIVAQVKDGSVTPEAALAIISSVYPTMPAETAKKIVEGATKQPEQTPSAGAVPQSAPPTEAQAPAGRLLQEEVRGFCPTGPGGGIDNSCGKGGVGVGRGDYGGDFKASVTSRGFDVDENGMMAFASRQEILATKEQANAILQYQAEGVYEELNGNLRLQGMDRSFTDFTDAQVEIIEKMDSAFETNSLTEPCTLFRGINDEEGWFSSLQEGDVFTDHAFQSTTLNPIVAVNFAEGFEGGNESPVVMRIHAKPGQPAIAADVIAGQYGYNTSPNLNETAQQGFSVANEIVLPRGTGYVVRGTTTEDGIRFVDVEVSNAG